MTKSTAFKGVCNTSQSDEESPRLVAAQGDKVVVRSAWRARDGRGNRLATTTLARNRVREGKLAEGNKFYVDLPKMMDVFAHAA